MIFGDLGGLKLPDICPVLQVRKNPEKPSPRKLVLTGDRTRARCVTGADATARPTAVDPLRLVIIIIIIIIIINNNNNNNNLCFRARQHLRSSAPV